MADAPALGAGAAQAAWRFDPSLAYKVTNPGAGPGGADALIPRARARPGPRLVAPRVPRAP